MPKHPGKRKKKQNSPSKHPKMAVTPMAHTTNGEEVETGGREKRPPYDHEKGG